MKAAEDQKRGFSFSFRFQSTFGLLLLEHPQLRGRRRQSLVTRIPVGSEPSSGCQVSTGRWLINRTFPLLNLRRMDGMMGMATWPPVRWPTRQSAEGTFPSSFPSWPPGLGWEKTGAHSLPCLHSLPVVPLPALALSFLLPLPLLHGRLLWPPLSPSEPSIVRRDLSADSLHLTFHCDLCVQHSCCGSHWAQIIFSWTVIPNSRIAPTEGLGLAREEGDGAGCFLRDFIIGVSSPNNMTGSGALWTRLDNQKPCCLS